MPQTIEALEKVKADVTEFTTLPVAGMFGQKLLLPCDTRLPWRVFAEELKELAGATCSNRRRVELRRKRIHCFR